MKNQTIFCLGITDFGRDITVGKDHLMTQFAKTNNVIMFNLSGNRVPSLKNRYDFFRFFRKILQWFLLPKSIKNIKVVFPIRFPIVGNKIFDTINNRILYLYFLYYKRKFFLKPPIIFTLSPFYGWAINRVRPQKIIYYVSDDYGMFSGNNKNIFDSYEEYFVPNCDGVLTVSNLLYQKKKKYNKNTIKIYNATNPDLFAPYKISKPKDMQKFNGKVVGCVGKIDDWYDLEFVDEIAQIQTKLNFVFIGPLVRSVDRILSENLYFLGQKEYDEIPNYIHSFDVCIIPYKNTERIKTVDMPLKLLDYLAAGKPVIAKNINVIKSTKKLYKICNDIDGFNSALIEALEEDETYRKQRINFAKENSWENRSIQISKWVNP